MSSNTSRRSLIITAAALPALAAPALATAARGADPDPIFAAIEVHKRAFMQQMKVCRINLHTDDDAAEKPDTEEAENEARSVTSKAEDDLCEIEPTTLAGVVALLSYGEDFSTQKFVLPDDPTQWYSGENWWAERTCDAVDRYTGEPIEISVLFFIMSNACEALRKLSVAEA